MSCEELQQEELEVLTSIYDGDQCYKQVTPTCFQYKIGNDGEPKSFLLEISWGEEYPNVPPNMNLDTFYNNKIIPDVKSTIIQKLLAEAEAQIGMAMTYTLIEWAKDNAEDLTSQQPEKLPSENIPPTEEKYREETPTSIKKEKKPQLSKNQKRKLADKLDSKGERFRGWDWVDIVKHLSQVGPRTPTDNAAS